MIPKKRISLSSLFFDDMKSKLDAYIQEILPAMERKDSMNGSVSLKIEFCVVKDAVHCENSPTGIREAKMPNITYKISMDVKSKAEHKDVVVGRGYEIVEDENGSYIITQEEVNGQLNMFNEFYERTEKNEDEGA